VRGRRLELVDEQGRIRVTAGALRTGGYGIALLDVGGHPRAWLALEPTGPVVVLTRAGEIEVEVGVHDPTPDALHVGGYLHLTDPPPATGPRPP
jgi:hypothetical protein